MEVSLLMPSQHKSISSIHVGKHESVRSFRDLVSKTMNIPSPQLILIAMGKIMEDKTTKNELTYLSSTYRVREKTAILVHIRQCHPIRRASKLKYVSIEAEKPNTHSHHLDPVSDPFGDFVCHTCHNDKNSKICCDCGCQKCHYKTGDPIICDQCDTYWHYDCTGLSNMPTDDYWFCPDCHNKDTTVVVGNGEYMKKVVSKQIYPKVTECHEFVSSNHVGSIPGIYCGQLWRERELLCRWGVHRSEHHIATSQNGATSVLLIGDGSEQTDTDDGYQFVMTGMIDENTKKRKSHPPLNEFNTALALTCDAPLDSKTGIKAYNWKNSQPIRVCRGTQWSKYSPEEGYRYDGLYKLVKYWPTTDSVTKNRVWKFLLRRDDPELPSWISVSKKIREEKGLRMIEPDPRDMKQLVKYEIPEDIHELIKKDKATKRVWDEILKMTFWSEYEFLEFLFDTALSCPSDICSKPIQVNYSIHWITHLYSF
ncbi:PUA-like domain-containing protein [Pilobolus umbonatus]|nr:PUA-like domain-containing protein [Pilobolus umbonatus]